ncbi:putative RNA methyltransferase [Gordonia sp. (in: high G+C Gram-positive bacteria)]|uniref:putative RNA methyltransferase n=1 Tax=Gordonia sp. (in: high G+C Gram-positive bacteria) TaxID=84139 RepID=UPI0039E59644
MCAHPLTSVVGDSSPRTLGCDAGHRFDVARQGYVSLLTGRSAGLSSDSGEMIAARRRALDRPPYVGLRAAVAETVDGGLSGERPLIVDAGCGTGQYLASCLDARPDALGVGLDLSKYAARAVAKAHPRGAGIVADLWQPWPLAAGVAGAVLAVFAPRGFAQARRVLREDGVLVVVTPRRAHLAELVGPMGMLGVEEDKRERLDRGLAEAGFGRVSTRTVTLDGRWDAAAIVDAVAMGPSAFHSEPQQLRDRAEALVGPSGTATVTAAVDITVAHR